MEALAWSPEYLSRVTVILAKLASLTPLPGNQGNRPENSLNEIFLLWLPHTNANIGERITALQQVLKAEPAKGWQVILGLLPAADSTMSHPTSMPRWQPWADGWSRSSVGLHRYEYGMALADLAFDHIGDNPERWSEALGGMLRFNEEITKRAISCLERTSEAFQTNPDGAFMLWDELRSTIQRHDEFAYADWAFPPATRESLTIIRDQLAPTDPVLKNLWLFEAQAELPGFMKYGHIVEHDVALEVARIQAIREISNATGDAGVWRLIGLGADAGTVGFVCGEHALVGEKAAQLPHSLTDADKNVLAFAESYVKASYNNRGEWNWIGSLHPLNWLPSERTRLAICLPFGPQVWDWVEAQEQEVQSEYWLRAPALMREWDALIIRRAVAGLLAAQRPFSAIDLVNFRGDPDRPSDLIAEVLEAGLSQSAAEEMRDIAHDVQKLIGCLQADKTFDRQRLARLEWGYLPYLERSYSKTGPDTLVEAVVENPRLYLELIQSAYRGKNDPPNALEDSENDRFHARRAGEFLDHLDVLPGMKEAGNIHTTTLNTWVQSALELSDASGHSEITAHKVGQFIGRAVYPHLDHSDILSQLAPVVEAHGNDDLTSGLVNGILNSRGVTSRDPFAGGQIEHELAAKFGERAKAARRFSAKLAKCFTTIQTHYEHYALREDETAERRRVGR